MTRRASIAGITLALFLGSADAATAAEWPADSPEAVVATLQAGLIKAAADRANTSVDARYRALEPVIVATHDLPYIAEFALRRQWPSLAEADRQRFVAAFERLSVMTYAARFVGVGQDTFREIEPGTAAGSTGRVQVATAVARAGQPDATLDYLLEREADGTWRIINIVADGVSDLALKRAEYQRLFASGGIEGLLAELERQTEQLNKN
jgi:phospholipid transport system substrate-binding protein